MNQVLKTCHNFKNFFASCKSKHSFVFFQTPKQSLSKLYNIFNIEMKVQLVRRPVLEEGLYRLNIDSQPVGVLTEDIDPFASSKEWFQ